MTEPRYFSDYERRLVEHGTLQTIYKKDADAQEACMRVESLLRQGWRYGQAVRTVIAQRKRKGGGE